METHDISLSDDHTHIDLDLFNHIMQEPPDVSLSRLDSFMAHDSIPSIDSDSLCSMHLDDCKIQASEDKQFPQTSQSDASGESSEASILISDQELASDFRLDFSVGYENDSKNDLKIYFDSSTGSDLNYQFLDRKQQPADDCDHEIPEESRSNVSGITSASMQQANEGFHGDKTPVVDLTTDTDSDCEEELMPCYERLGGKRSFPHSMDPYGKPSKALYSRNHDIKGSNLVSHMNVAHAVQLYDPGSQFPVFSNLSAQTMMSEPYSWNLLCSEGKHELANVVMPLQNIGSDSDGVSSKISAVMLHDSGLLRSLSSPVSPYAFPTRDNTLALPARNMLKVLDSTVFKEEASLDVGIMTVPLLKHQRIALAWMVNRERGTDCVGGILADDQGLGKTVSTIALILKAPSPSKSLCIQSSTVDLDDDDDVVESPCIKLLDQKPALEIESLKKKPKPAAGTLIVCPTSVLRQWAQELKEKVSDTSSLSVLVYHGSNRAKNAEELAKHDIVLTTYSIVSLEVPKQPLPDGKESIDDRNPVHYGLAGFGSEQSSRKKGKGKKADSDTVDDEKAGLLAQVNWFRVVLDEAQSIKNRRTQAARACWGLRAKRRWCLSGTPIQNTIDDLYSYFRFLKYEPYCAYKSFRSEIKDRISRNPIQGYSQLQSILQKVLLRRTKSTMIDGEPIIKLPKKNMTLQQVEFSPEERDFYSKLEVQSQKQFQIYAESGTVQSNYVNILWLLLRLRQACDHPRLVKGEFSDLVQTDSKKYATMLPDDKRRSLLSILERNSEACGICLDAPEDAVITSCSHVFCRQCIYNRVANDDNSCCPVLGCQAVLNISAVFSTSDLNGHGNVNSRPNDHSLDLIPKPYFNDPSESSKIKAVINVLRSLPVSTTGNSSADKCDVTNSLVIVKEKAIVFSQWTSMLDLLEISLKKEGFCYRRLDGTMSIQARDRALSDFKQLPNVTVIIMSLKAASLGLNMVTASHVLLIDVWWNPTTEDQAIDRAHRIGQTRDVHVSRFTVKNTIEDRILALQEKKRQMVASAFGEESASDQKTRLSVEEMRFLFKA